jgi:hypothetical protein
MTQIPSYRPQTDYTQPRIQTQFSALPEKRLNSFQNTQYIASADLCDQKRKEADDLLNKFKRGNLISELLIAIASNLGGNKYAHVDAGHISYEGLPALRRGLVSQMGNYVHYDGVHDKILQLGKGNFESGSKLFWKENKPVVGETFEQRSKRIDRVMNVRKQEIVNEQLKAIDSLLQSNCLVPYQITQLQEVKNGLKKPQSMNKMQAIPNRYMPQKDSPIPLKKESEKQWYENLPRMNLPDIDLKWIPELLSPLIPNKSF